MRRPWPRKSALLKRPRGPSGPSPLCPQRPPARPSTLARGGRGEGSPKPRWLLLGMELCGDTQAGGLLPAWEVSSAEALAGMEPPTPCVWLPPELLLPVEILLGAAKTPRGLSPAETGGGGVGPQLWQGSRLASPWAPWQPSSRRRCWAVAGDRCRARGCTGSRGGRTGRPDTRHCRLPAQTCMCAQQTRTPRGAGRAGEPWDSTPGVK